MYPDFILFSFRRSGSPRQSIPRGGSRSVRVVSPRGGNRGAVSPREGNRGAINPRGSSRPALISSQRFASTKYVNISAFCDYFTT